MIRVATAARLNPMPRGSAQGPGEPTIASVTDSPSGTTAGTGPSPGGPDSHEGRLAAQAGDWIEVDAAGGTPPRCGLVLEVLGEGRHAHFRVRWDEEHVSLFYPAERGFTVRRGAARAGG